MKLALPILAAAVLVMSVYACAQSKTIERLVPELGSAIATSSPTTSSSACVVDGVWHLPNPEWTPGKLCSKDDPDYDGDRYAENVPHCRRDVSEATKVRVAERYGYTKADLPRLEIDHLFELAAGGSNSEENLWAQPIDEARVKDKVEDEVYRGMRDGSLTQADAVAKIRAWRPETCR